MSSNPLSPTETLSFFDRGSHTLAYHHTTGDGPTLVWLGGFRSDMDGSKALAVEAYARERGQACLRFDYSGHGQSTGAFTDGTIGSWTEDARAIISALVPGPKILIGSSMGGWIGLLLAIDAAKAGDPMDALVLIAPAPDFTEELMWPRFTPEQQRAVLEDGQLAEDSPYDPEPTIITRALFEDGRNHLILGAPITTGCPVRILQGVADTAVPHTHALRLMDALVGEDVVLSLVKDGDHRLSRPEDLDLLVRTLDALGRPAGSLL
ncbi:MAG: alpha/beta hydrolase [Devosiaceae bacterium]|nr:alpha/beta hydrolase [Devosiaceae bacterium MH13]